MILVMAGFVNWITDIDQSVFFFLNGKHNPFWDAVMTLFTQTGYWLLLYLPILFVIIKKYRVKSLVILILLALAILISDQFSGLVKESVQRFRPTNDPEIQSMVHYVIRKGGLYGFFSAHASNTFTLAMFSSLLFRNSRYGILIFSWAAVVSYSRIYLGVHYPLDILAGMLFGILTGYATYKLLALIERNFLPLRSPKLADTRMDKKELGYISLILGVIVVITFVIINCLQKFNWAFQ